MAALGGESHPHPGRISGEQGRGWRILRCVALAFYQRGEALPDKRRLLKSGSSLLLADWVAIKTAKLTNLRRVGYRKHVPGLEVEGFRIAVNTRDELGHNHTSM